MENFNKRRMLPAVLAVVMAIGTLTGCGSSSTASASASVTSGSSSATSSALTLDAIKAKGKLSVATEAAYEPFEYLDTDGETIIGYNADLLKQICDDLGVELDYHDLPFQGILAGLEAGKYDMVGATLGITAERAKKYTMTEPIEKGTTVFVKRKGDTSINSASDMEGKIVGTQTSAYNETDVKDYNEKLKAAGGSGYAELKTYNSFPEAFNDLRNGQIDLVAQNYASCAAIVSQNPDTYEIVCDSDGNPDMVALNDVWLGWAVRKSDTELSDFINSEIEKFKENGFLASEQKKWFGQTVDLPSDNYIPES